MILTNEQVAAAARARGGCRRSTASTPSPTRPGSSAWSSSWRRSGCRRRRWARGCRRSRRARSPPRRAGWRGARPGGADTAARRIPRSCSAPSNRPNTASATAATPASAAPPTRTSPRRSAATPTWSCTGRCWRRWGRGRRRRAWPRPATSPPTARPASASRRRSSAAPTTSAPPTCSSASCGERGLDAEFEGEVSGVIRAGAFVSFGGELGDVYEGMLPARRLPGESLRAGPGRGRAGRRGRRSTLRLGDPIAVRVSRRRRRRAAGRTWSSPMAKKSKKPRLPASGDVVTNRRARHKFEWVETMEAGIVLQRLRGEGAARRQGADDRRLRGRRRRRGLAAQAPHPALRVRQRRRP